MKKISIFLIALVTMALTPLQASAAIENSDTLSNITELTKIVEAKREKQGFVSEDDIDLLMLKEELSKIEVTSESYWTPDAVKEEAFTTFGYGQWHNLGKGWKARVDKPTHGGASKPHVHVEKGDKKGVENVDGTKSHGKNLNSAGVPKDIQNKARGLADYKKGKKDLANMKKAKQQITSKKLNLRKYADIVIAIGIFVSVVGLMIFASGAVSAWGAFLLAI